MDVFCGDIIIKDLEYGASTFHYHADFAGVHTFETCSSISTPVTLTVSTDAAVPVPVTGVTSHDCGLNENGKLVYVDLAVGSYIATVDLGSGGSDLGIFRFGVQCPDTVSYPSIADFRGVIDTALMPNKTCDDLKSGLETCDSYRFDLEHKVSMKHNHFGGLHPSFVCADPLDFQPDVVNPQDSFDTCDSMIRRMMGEALYSVGTTLEFSDCSELTGFHPFRIADVSSTL
jgi:hypothetical protein